MLMKEILIACEESEQVKKYCIEAIKKYPVLETEIYDTYDLFRMEIEDSCASVTHEAELFFSHINELIKNYENG